MQLRVTMHVRSDAQAADAQQRSPRRRTLHFAHPSVHSLGAIWVISTSNRTLSTRYAMRTCETMVWLVVAYRRCLTTLTLLIAEYVVLAATGLPTGATHSTGHHSSSCVGVLLKPEEHLPCGGFSLSRIGTGTFNMTGSDPSC
jgi:hypothetical protein